MPCSGSGGAGRRVRGVGVGECREVYLTGLWRHGTCNLATVEQVGRRLALSWVCAAHARDRAPDSRSRTEPKDAAHRDRAATDSTAPGDAMRGLVRKEATQARGADLHQRSDALATQERKVRGGRS